MSETELDGIMATTKATNRKNINTTSEKANIRLKKKKTLNWALRI